MRTRPILAVLFVFASIAGCSKDAPLVERTRVLLGTVVTIKLNVPEGLSAEPLLEKAFQEMSRIDSLCGYLESSELARINRSSGNPVRISPDVALVLRKAYKYSVISGGALDVTIDPVSRLWGRFEGEALGVPTRSSIDSAVRLVDYRQLLVEDSMARFLTRGGSIDLGSIAKGYAVDRCVALLESLGAAGGLVDAGGDVRTFGEKPGGGPWKVGLRDPRAPDSIVTVFELGDRSVATSGDYERYFIEDSVRYHHILNPRTGFPADGSCSVTIITGEACDADAIATAVFVMGPEAGMRLIESLPDVEGLIIRCTGAERDLFRSAGLDAYENAGHVPES